MILKIAHFLTAVQRPWHLRERHNYRLHPAVKSLFEEVQPRDWHAVLLEWPHVSTTDPHRLAYTRSEEHGIANRQTVTSVQKYLARHWPQLKSHEISKWAATYSPDEFYIADTLPEMIRAVELGPWSCMQSSYSGGTNFDEEVFKAWNADPEAEEPDWDDHFYAAYDPQYGWRLAVQKRGSEFIGRALVNGKVFVRTYAPAGPRSNAPNPELEAWLEKQGYVRNAYWPNGLKLAKPDHRHARFAVPYIDGTHHKVSDCGNYLVMDYDGDMECSNTDGTYDEVEDDSIGTCCDCGSSIHEDDCYVHVGRYEEEMSCCTGNYTYVRGHSADRHGFREYYVPDDQAASVHDQHYSIDTENPPDYVRQLEDGDWAHEDDVVEVDDEYYLIEDPRSVWLEELGVYALKEDCWQDHEGGWHGEKEPQVELDGELYSEAQAQEFLSLNQIPLIEGA